MRRLVALALLVTAAGCTTGHDVATSTPVSAPPQPAVTPTAAPVASPEPSDTAPARPAPTRPARTAGPLTAADLPSAAALGPGWRAYADPGDAEEGYLGNGTPVYQRAPQEVLAVVLPLGCVHRSALPRPAYVLAEDYRQRGSRQGTAMRLRFRTASAARGFLDTWVADLRRCAAQGRDPVSGAAAPVTQIVTKGTAVVSRRLDATDAAGNPVPWTEAKAVLDRDVLIVAEQGSGDADALVRALRGRGGASG